MQQGLTFMNMTSSGSTLMPSLKLFWIGFKPALQSKASLLRQLTPCIGCSSLLPRFLQQALSVHTYVGWMHMHLQLSLTHLVP